MAVTLVVWVALVNVPLTSVFSLLIDVTYTLLEPSIRNGETFPFIPTPPTTIFAAGAAELVAAVVMFTELAVKEPLIGIGVVLPAGDWIVTVFVIPVILMVDTRTGQSLVPGVP